MAAVKRDIAVTSLRSSRFCHAPASRISPGLRSRLGRHFGAVEGSSWKKFQ